MQTHSVPTDRILESRFTFAPPSLERVRSDFEKTHEASEKIYHGGGVWGTGVLGDDYPPMYRNTAWRVLGYLEALKAEPNDLYRTRALEGAEYLLKEQQPNGSYLWWCYETHGHPDTHHLLYCTANPGVALLETYDLTGDPRFLNASKRAADWAVGHPLSSNNNYNSFAVWHLCEHARVTGERAYLESTIYKTRESVYPRQLPNGAWAGHNAWIFYHGIIARGFAVLAGALPPDHEAAPELRKRLIMAVNHIVEEQREDGRFRACFDPEEWEKSRDPKSAYSSNEPEIYDPFALQTLVYTLEYTDLDVTNPLYGVLGSVLPEDLDRHQGMTQYACGVGYRWLAQHAARA